MSSAIDFYREPGRGTVEIEDEIADNAWLIVRANSQLIFDIPIEERWETAAKQLGIDLNLISNESGHA